MAENTCNPAAIYGAIEFCPGKPVLPGIRRRTYYIRRQDIAKWPANPYLAAIKSDTPAQADTLVVLTSTFELATGKNWLPIDAEVSRSNVESETQGEAHSRTFLNRATLVHAGTDKKISGFAAAANNDDLVFLVQQADGRFRLIGSEFFDTQVNTNISLGQGPTAESGSTVTVEGTDFTPAPFYEGEILLEGDVKISGVDGSAITS